MDIPITLYCQTCGKSDFNHNDDKTYVQCNECKREYHSGINELLEYNQNQVDAALEQESEKLLDDFAKSLEKQFRNNKFIKFKR
jgi:hypothetical protein